MENLTLSIIKRRAIASIVNCTSKSPLPVEGKLSDDKQGSENLDFPHEIAITPLSLSLKEIIDLAGSFFTISCNKCAGIVVSPATLISAVI